MGKLSLNEVSHQVSESVYDFYTNEATADPVQITMDDILEQACSALPSNSLRFLIPKIILVDHYYKANLLKYLHKPDADEFDSRFGYYRLIAEGLQKLDLASRIEDIQGKAPRLCAVNLNSVATLCNAASDVVQESTGRSSIVFASKLLHFSAPDLFPIIDSKSEEKLREVLMELDDEANDIITNARKGLDREVLLDLWYEKHQEDYDKHWEKNIEGSRLLRILEEKYPDHNNQLLKLQSADRYGKFATDILCLEQAICLNGGPVYSLRELDKYLYWNDYQLGND